MSHPSHDRLSALHPRRLRCERLENPLGIDVRVPALSWRIAPETATVAEGDALRGLRQTGYRILVASSPDLLAADQGDLWDSRMVESERSTFIEYAGRPLASRERCHWKVMAWIAGGELAEPAATAWSAPAVWSMGLLEPGDWSAEWIGSPTAEIIEPAPLFRKTFRVDRPVKHATAYICGLGYHELSLNGAKVGDHLFDPKVTRYDRRVLYVTHDVTSQIIQGENAAGVMLGNGWYNYHVRNPWDFDKAPWRDKPKMLLRIEIGHDDGSVTTVVSDASWKHSTGPVRYDGMLNGETHDARLEKAGWDTAGYDDSDWLAAKPVEAPAGRLAAQMIQPIRITGRIRPVSVAQPQPGVFVFDLGQNIAGAARLRVSGPAGARITLRYAELLNPDGTIDQTNINTFCESGDFQTEHYILKGDGVETWNARFMYYGFQYVEVTGFPGEPTPDDVTGLVMHTDVERAGSFECSNDLLNKIHQCNLWSFLNNFHGYPTDCPNREKIGWTGDAHIAGATGLYNLDPDAVYSQWLADFGDEQQPNGELPGIIPTGGWGYERWGGPAWCSTLILLPWYMYQFRGDTRVLADHYPTMRRYLDFIEASSPDGINGQGMGDWFPSKTETPVEITSTSYYYIDAVIMAEIAAILGHAEDAAEYARLAARVRTAFNDRFFDRETARYGGGAQTADSCAIYQNLVAPEDLDAVVANLAASVRRNDDHLDCGILGAKYILHALSDHGHVELAYRIASQNTWPSWGDMVRQGATTLWEGWNADIGTHNHVMLGDISAWFYKVLAGIECDPEGPGFKRILIKPKPAGDLACVRAWHDCPHGRIVSEWNRTNGKLAMRVTIPPNTTATIHVPASGLEAVTESGLPAAESRGVAFLGMRDGAAVFQTGSGCYHFKSALSS
jgi:alpha-L-rhamnosidase